MRADLLGCLPVAPMLVIRPDEGQHGVDQDVRLELLAVDEGQQVVDRADAGGAAIMACAVAFVPSKCLTKV
jgi:hypothetical protein